MEEKVLFLNDFDIITFEKALNKVFQKIDCKLVTMKNLQYTCFNTGIKIPTIKQTVVKFPDNVEIKIDLTKSSQKDYDFHCKKYRMSIIPLSENANGHIDKLIDEFNAAINSTLPDSFISLEHFEYYLKETTVLKLEALPENLIIPTERALKTIFKDWEYLGSVCSNNNNLSQTRIRIEIKENEFQYVELNRFSIYRKDNILLAAGISYEKSLTGIKYFCAIFTKYTDTHIIEKMFDKKFDELIFSRYELKGGKFTGDFQFIKLQNKVTFDDIVLEEGVHEKLNKEIFKFFEMKDIYKKAGLPFKRGVALYGPTGTGKTMIAKLIASTMKETVIWVKTGDISSPDDINRIFRFARLCAPSVIILEDIDFYAQDRDLNSPTKIGVATLMANLDGLEENEGILVIVTTNRIDVIEKAIINRPGRIDTKIYIGELGRDCIAKLLEKKLGKFKRDFESFKDVIPQYTVMSGSMVIELSSAILRQACRNGSDDIIILRKYIEKELKDYQRRENRMVGFKNLEFV